MKMVSQLTRQAMGRHRTLCVKEPPAPAASSPAAEPVSPLYAPALSAPAAPPAPVLPRSTAPAPAAPPRPKTIYQQLMVNHDRMRERHLHHT